MTPLARLLAERIREGGPISVADYMAECLLHPIHGYYTTRDPFGAAGDFTTAPEISQMFGELVGLALAQAWLDQGAPSPFTLAELGPGRGTLMADILRATIGVPGFHRAAEVVLVEASPVLKLAQETTIGPSCDRRPSWIDDAGDLPEQPLFLVANEFFDALPIHQYQFADGGWHERLVGLAGSGLSFGLAERPTLPATMAHVQREDGVVIEEGRIGRVVIGSVHRRLARHGGLALVVDYGGWRSRGDTLQALRGHAFDHPLAHPGEADLTAHVDFEALVAPDLAHAYATQGEVLQRLGIRARAERLAGNLAGPARESHLAALRRLTHPEEMGSLFKVLALTRAGAPLPPGFSR